MTSNVLIANKNLIALAADEKITLFNEKTYAGVQKIFKISDTFSGGIMINGNVDFEGIPLKSLINEFSKSYDFDSMESIVKIKDVFIDFLALKTNSTNPETYLKDLLDLFKEKVEYSDFSKFIANESRHKIQPFIKKLPNFENEFRDVIPDGYDKLEYNLILWEIFSYYLTFEGTGIIFAGYNRNQFFPSFVEINIYFNNDGVIIHEVVEEVENSKKPIIRVYAINEEAYTFLSGVGTDFENSILDFLKESNIDSYNAFSEFLKSNMSINSQSHNEILYYFKELLNEAEINICNFIQYFKSESLEFISEYTESLPSNIICNLAIILIVLTSFKQKITPEVESVGSDVDIAIIEPFKQFKWVDLSYKRL